MFDYDAAGNRIMRWSVAPYMAPVSFSSVVDSIPAATEDTVPATFKVSVYPNPVQSDLLVTIENLAAAADLPLVFEVQLTNMLGAVHYRQTHRITGPVAINMSTYLTGWYQLIIVRGAEVQQLTVYKQ